MACYDPHEDDARAEREKVQAELQRIAAGCKAEPDPFDTLEAQIQSLRELRMVAAPQEFATTIESRVERLNDHVTAWNMQQAMMEDTMAGLLRQMREMWRRFLAEEKYVKQVRIVLADDRQQAMKRRVS